MLIALTGIDGSGKSTQIELLNKFFKKNHYLTFISKAYGQAEESCWGQFLQHYDSLAITFIFQGLHRQQYTEAVKAINDGKIVLADRWDETFLSFHSEFGFLAKHPKLRRELNELAFGKLIPDLTFFIDVEPKIAHQRLEGRGKNFLDKGDEKYHEQIRQATIKVLKGRSVIFIDGLKSVNEINKIIISEVLKKIQNSKKFKKN